jgi:hypothetical protein
MNNKWLIDCNKAAELPRTEQQDLFKFLNSVVMKQKLQPDELTTFYDWLNKVSGKAIKASSCPDCIGHTISGLRMALKQSLKHEASGTDNSGDTQSNEAERVQEPKKVSKKGKASGKKSGSTTDETPMK